MKRVTPEHVAAQSIAQLGLDASQLAPDSPEVLAAALRRAAAFVCPCVRASLVSAVVAPLRGLVSDVTALKAGAEGVLESLIGHGDLVEVRREHTDGGASATMLYAAPPGFVHRQSGAVLLLGVACDHLTALPEELERRIEHVGHVRRLRPDAGEDLAQMLRELGLLSVSMDQWGKAPPSVSASELLVRHTTALQAEPRSGDVPGLRILNPHGKVTYYKGRWGEPRGHTGFRVGRREQAYGSDLWCHVRLVNGRAERLVDFPSLKSRWRGCDEAWRLLMAMDAHAGHPQVYRSQRSASGSTEVQFFSPVPMWAQRRWDAVGRPLRQSGCLFAYEFSENEAEEELRYARETLWMTDADGIPGGEV
jgi:hypothetical protein